MATKKKSGFLGKLKKGAKKILGSNPNRKKAKAAGYNFKANRKKTPFGKKKKA